MIERTPTLAAIHAHTAMTTATASLQHTTNNLPRNTHHVKLYNQKPMTPLTATTTTTTTTLQRKMAAATARLILRTTNYTLRRPVPDKTTWLPWSENLAMLRCRASLRHSGRQAFWHGGLAARCNKSIDSEKIGSVPLRKVCGG